MSLLFVSREAGRLGLKGRRRGKRCVRRRGSELLRVLTVDQLSSLHNLWNLMCRLGSVVVALSLRGCPTVLQLLEVLAWVRLRLLRRALRLLRVAMVLHLGLRRRALGRLLLGVLSSLRGLVLVIIWVHLGAGDVRAGCVLRRVEGLVLFRAVSVLPGNLLVVLVGRWVLLWLLVYPALAVIAALRAHSSEWGPVVLLLLRIWRILLRVLLLLLLMALERCVFGRHLRMLVLLLQKGVEVVLVVFVRVGEMRAGSLLPVPLIPLGSSQTVLFLLLEFEGARIALAH